MGDAFAEEEVAYSNDTEGLDKAWADCPDDHPVWARLQEIKDLYPVCCKGTVQSMDSL